MQCPKCKSEIQKGAKNCENCGAPVNTFINNKIVRIVAILLFIALFIVAVVIYTSNKDNTDPHYHFTTGDEAAEIQYGKPVYDKNGIKVIAMYYDGSGYNPRFVFRIENSSAHDIYITCDDVSFNDYMMSASLYTKVTAGKRASANLLFEEEDFLENNITTLKKLEFKLIISDVDLEEDNPINDTENIVISFT